jgi:hypothetical protein
MHAQKASLSDLPLARANGPGHADSPEVDLTDDGVTVDGNRLVDGTVTKTGSDFACDNCVFSNLNSHKVQRCLHACDCVKNGETQPELQNTLNDPL